MLSESRFPKLLEGLGIRTKECNCWKPKRCLGGDRSIHLSYVPTPEMILAICVLDHLLKSIFSWVHHFLGASLACMRFNAYGRRMARNFFAGYGFMRFRFRNSDV